MRNLRKGALFLSIPAQGWKCCSSTTFPMGNLARFRKRSEAARQSAKSALFREKMIFSAKVDFYWKWWNLAKSWISMKIHARNVDNPKEILLFSPSGEKVWFLHKFSLFPEKIRKFWFFMKIQKMLGIH